MADEQNLNEVLDDLCARFLVNLPSSEYESFERLFFAIESAHWFYEDFYREKNLRLPKLPLKAFAARLFNHTPLLQPYRDEVDRLTSEFKSYKQEVPTCGAAMLNRTLDKVLLVRGWGSSAKWGFPKGKVAKDETELQAAIREVLEETGFDLTDYVDDSTYYIDSMTFGRLNRIFVVPGIPEDAHFVTQTRKEISDIAWVPVSTLPEFQKKNARQAQSQQEVSHDPSVIPSNKMYFHVAPYTVRLRAWIKRQRKRGGDGPRGSKSTTPARKNGGAENGDRTDRGDRGRKSDKGQSSDPTRVPQGSPPRGKRNKKDKRKQENRDVETFGSGGNGGALSAAERDSMFQKYVRDADKRAKELSLGEDMWPTTLTGKPLAASGALDEEQSGQMLNVESEQTQNEEEPLFTFDKKAILARMLG